MMRTKRLPSRLRAFVALVRTERGYHGSPIVAADLTQAQSILSGIDGDVVAVLEQTHITMLGMALEMGRALLQEGACLKA
jgi:hypothetical protein